MLKHTMVALAGAAAIGVGFAGAAEAATISYDISWIGSSGYSLEGMFGFDDSFLGTGAIDETALDSFMIEGFLNGISIGSWDLSNGVDPGARFNFNFDTTSETFIVGGLTDGDSGQSWNFPGSFGFASGDLFQGLYIDDTAIGFISIDTSTLTATRKAGPEPEPVPEPSSMLGLLAVGAVAAGSALKKKASA